MVKNDLVVSRITGVVAAFTLLSSCGASRGSSSQEPGYLAQRPPPPSTMRETADVAIAVSGKAPNVVFEFWDCKFEEPAAPIYSIVVGTGGGTTCSVRRTGESIPSVWKYGEGGDEYEVERCDPLVPGEYGITVYGGERGRAEFDVTQDGTVTITKGQTCDSMPAERKQEPNGE